MSGGALRRLSLQQALSALHSGALLAHSTTSLLGIGALPQRVDATDTLDRLKERVAGRGYVHVVGAVDQAQGWVEDLSVANALWRRISGPLTLVMPATAAVPAASRSADGTVAIRLDRHPVVGELCAALRSPLISTSLNLAGQPPCDDLDAIPAPLREALAGSYVRPPSPMGGASTLIRLDGAQWTMLRLGMVSAEEIRAALGADHVSVD